IFSAEGAFAPNHRVGIPIGLATGITSTFAHGAGPIMSMFLIPQRLPKDVFVATNVLIFMFVNWLKMPFFCIDRTQIDLPVFAPHALISRHTLFLSLIFFPLVPLGVWIGVWMNRRISERAFMKVVFAFLFVTGLELIFQFEHFFTRH
ncbi:MAG TPA: sulfite exporter TauE/SafE family protein, partial [Candidatus Limnocylindria bacterium]|nr:sulfite exporter TauE/SafE family protein [Candidatus Limnocylindria bacterium]